MLLQSIATWKVTVRVAPRGDGAEPDRDARAGKFAGIGVGGVGQRRRPRA